MVWLPATLLSKPLTIPSVMVTVTLGYSVLLVYVTVMAPPVTTRLSSTSYAVLVGTVLTKILLTVWATRTMAKDAVLVVPSSV